ncbi:hypothetical protein H2199_001702 [Coniosporium tulheliwenetii]|uniref:Uncharacterized protein n=1 Tax=Coniosporium tulheliwenetii TaxID=3383036 RepID=A0ACC2ZK23_9PEZI|nr:hypothetical protein H2199_001702 [Cladosporium sp. JES 115]
MSFKHFINDPEKLVNDALEALTYANPTLQYLRAEKAIVTTAHDSSTNVSIISGGGAGHEPAHAAYVGRNMLSAAVSGSIFASPSVSQIYNTINHNYTGDVFNSSLAASKASAAGVPTEFIVVADDVSVGRAKGGKVGRRGLAGTILVHKITSAYAASSAAPSLGAVRKLAQEVADNLVTAAASLDRVHVPGRRKHAADFLGEDELELGMGIHNEPGLRKISPLPDLHTLVGDMLKMLLDLTDTDRAYVDFSATEGDGVVLMVNNLGGTSVLELGAVAAEVHRQLESSYRIAPLRSYVGTYMTSLNGPGFSITLLRASQQMLDFLDVEVECAGWSPGSLPPASRSKRAVFRENRIIEKAPQANGVSSEFSSCDIWKRPEYVEPFHKALRNACSKVIAAEPTITEYDTQVGDGDCGTTLRRGAEAISSYIANTPSTATDPLTDLLHIASIIEETMDGTSGAITAIYSVTPARPGDRTLMDALTPFVETLARTLNVRDAAAAARLGADRTMGMQAKLGRSVYVEASAYDRVPDPGAIGLAELFEGLAEAL